MREDRKSLPVAPYTLLVDLEIEARDRDTYIDQLKRECRAAQLLIHDASTRVSLTDALSEAARTKEPLVYIKYPLLISDAVVAALSRSLDQDPMFSAALPRFAQDSTDLVYSLPESYGLGASARPTLTRRALASLPEQWMMPELLAGCFLVKQSIVANAPSILNYTSLHGAILHLLAAARRRGFRVVIDNRVVIPTSAAVDRIYPSLDASERDLLSKASTGHYSQLTDENVGHGNLNFSDATPDWFARHPAHRLEKMLTEAYPPLDRKRRILIDSRSMMEAFNGTTISQLGYLAGFLKHSKQWDIHVLVREGPLKTHRLRERFPALTFHENPDGVYACTAFMSQPVFVGTIRDIHHHAFLVAGNMLDTITWDIVLGSPHDTEKVWNFCAKYFDCMFYISEFSKRQFNRRFPTHQGLSEYVTYLSFAKSENVDQRIAPVPGENLVVFGNGYDHKDVAPTVVRLRRLFPEKKITVLGPVIEGVENVDCFVSGSLTDDEVQALVAKCAVLIFPSWIEGFGMPVVNALAYGKNVVVRKLPLWQEMATQSSRLDGRLFEFEDEESLKQAVERALNSETQFAIQPHGESKNIDWAYCAKAILDGFETHLATADSRLWMARNQMMELISP